MFKHHWRTCEQLKLKSWNDKVGLITTRFIHSMGDNSVIYADNYEQLKLKSRNYKGEGDLLQQYLFIQGEILCNICR